MNKCFGVESCEMDVVLNPGVSLGHFLLGQSLHSVLTSLRNCPGYCVEVKAPEKSLGRIIVVANTKFGLSFTTVFDNLYQLAVSVSVCCRQREGERTVGDFPRIPLALRQTNDRLKITLRTEPERERIKSILQPNGVHMSSCRVVNVAGRRFEVVGDCNGMVLTFQHAEEASSEVVAPPPSIASLQDALSMRCVLVEVQVVPVPSSPIYHLLTGSLQGENQQTLDIPFVHTVVDPSTGRAVGIGIKSMHFAPAVLFDDSVQTVLTQLGVPNSFYYREHDNVNIFQPVVRAQKICQHHQPDLFFNYFDLGLDILFDSTTLTVKKFILHTNTPSSGEFGSYNRCHFCIAFLHHVLAVGEKASFVLNPSCCWSKVVQMFGSTCTFIKNVYHRDLEYLGHVFISSKWYTLVDQLHVEVLRDNDISRLILTPGTTAIQIPSGPSDVGVAEVPVRPPAPVSSLTSEISNPGSEDFEDAESHFNTPLTSLQSQPFVQESQIKCDHQKTTDNINVLVYQCRRKICRKEREDESEERDSPFQIPCFSEPEESDGTSEEEESNVPVHCVTEDGESALVPSPPASSPSVDEHSPDEDNSADFDSDKEYSVTSSYDIVNSIMGQEESEDLQVSSTPPSVEDTVTDDLDEKSHFRYRPGAQHTTGRLSELIASTSHHSKDVSKNSPPVVGQNVMPESKRDGRGNKQSRSKNKYRLSQKEEEKLQRLSKPTFSSSQHYKEDNVSAIVESSKVEESCEPIQVEESCETIDEHGNMSVVLDNLRVEDELGVVEVRTTEIREDFCVKSPHEQQDLQEESGRMMTGHSMPTVSPNTDLSVLCSSPANEEESNTGNSVPIISLGSFQNGLLKQFGITPSVDNGTLSPPMQSSDSSNELGPSATLGINSISDSVPVEDTPTPSQEGGHPTQELPIPGHVMTVQPALESQGVVQEGVEPSAENSHLEKHMDKWSTVNSPSSNELFRDTEAPMISLTSSMMENLDADGGGITLRLQSRLKVLKEYLSVVFTSPWKRGFPSVPEDVDCEEAEHLFVSALEVILEHRKEFLTLQRCTQLLPKLSSVLSQVSWSSAHSCRVLCETVKNAAQENMEPLERYKAGKTRVSSSEHHNCQVCYYCFETLSDVLDRLPVIEEVSDSIREAKEAVDLVLRRFEPTDHVKKECLEI